MATIEIEFRQNLFEQLTLLLLSAGPNPFPTLQALGPQRLISRLKWDAPQVGAAPSGFVAPPGTVVARVNLRLTHVSTEELDADPAAAGATSDAIAWVLTSASTSPPTLAVRVVGIDVVGGAPQRFNPFVGVGRRTIGGFEDAGAPTAAAVLLANGVVTVRFVTSGADNLLGPPLNLLADTGDQWSLRLSPELFTDNVLSTIQDGLDPLPSGTTVEEEPQASWIEQDGVWRVAGSVGLNKKDACPGLFEDVDLSVTIWVLLTPTVDVNAGRLNLTLRLESDASDWDALRCWLGSLGGILSMGIAFVDFPIGFFTGLGTLAAVGGEIAKQAGGEVKKTDPGQLFEKVSDDETSVTYARSVRLSPIGTIGDAATGPLGLVVRGTMVYLPASHTVAYSPNASTLRTTWFGRYDCGLHRWQASLMAEGIGITDTAHIGPEIFTKVPVTVFPTSSVRPGEVWAIRLPAAPEIEQSVDVSLRPATGVFGQVIVSPTGKTGRLYVHTSAGVRRYDIAPVPAYEEPSGTLIAIEEFNCRNFARNWSRIQQLKWLVDPPPWHLGHPPLRQWLLTISEVPEGATITLRRHRHGRPYGTPISITADRPATAAIEVVTDEATELEMEHTVRTSPEGRMTQRWLLPRHIVELGAPARKLARDQGTVAALTDRGLVAFDFRTGRRDVHTAAVQLGRDGARLRAVERTFYEFRDGTIIRRHTGRHIGMDDQARGEHGPPPFSLTLRGGRVAAAWEDKLVIAVPWGSARPPELSMGWHDAEFRKDAEVMGLHIEGAHKQS